jgi:diaminohydroxyphosphoribosylaminopyrimidine deaminase/5-amino-6-(5-phosphoribosylamino)uracil reductase
MMDLNSHEIDMHWMRLALEEAAKGKGCVEPNPMVGCVVVRDGRLIAKGYHRYFGGPHAEAEALQSIVEPNATIYVTLEPCSHFGKTPPCAPLVASKRPNRVVVAMPDPFPAVAGRGIALLQEHGIEVTTGILESEARELNAPYLKLLKTGKPWTIAKWAMTLDGAIATATGDSKWISNELSRASVHQMRSDLDGVIVGIQTVLKDDPLLTARLPDNVKPHRVATRVVLDHRGRLPLDSKLVQSIPMAPLWVIVADHCPVAKREAMARLGASVFAMPADYQHDSLTFALEELGRARATNVLIEGGGAVLGSAFDRNLVDQVECYIAPKVFGGDAKRPVLGAGLERVQDASLWRIESTRVLGDDIHMTMRRREPI